MVHNKTYERTGEAICKKIINIKGGKITVLFLCLQYTNLLNNKQVEHIEVNTNK